MVDINTYGNISPKDGTEVSQTQQKRDDQNQLSTATIANLLEDHQKALSADFRASISTLKAKLDHIQTTMADQAQNIVQVERQLTGWTLPLEPLEATGREQC